MKLAYREKAAEVTSSDFRTWRVDAYVPQPIADLEILLRGGFVELLDRTARACSELDALSLRVGLSTESIARQLLRAEAVASSRIEGFELSHRRLSKALFAHEESESAASRDTARFVAGNVVAMQRAIERAQAGELGVGDILAIHEALLANTRDARIAGHVRSGQNWIGGTNPSRAAFVPPPAEDVLPLLDDLAAFANRVDVPALVQAAIVHAQFETIHPFADGNGRVGRALISLVLARREVSPSVPLPVSLVLASDADRYVAGLTDYRYVEIDDWLAFFVEACGRAAAEALALTERIDELQSRWYEQAGRPRRHSAAARMLRELVTLPVFTVESMAEHLGVSRRSVETAVLALEAGGVISRTSAGRRNRVFETVGLFALMDTFERELAPVDRAPRSTRPAG